MHRYLTCFNHFPALFLSFSTDKKIRKALAAGCGAGRNRLCILHKRTLFFPICRALYVGTAFGVSVLG